MNNLLIDLGLARRVGGDELADSLREAPEATCAVLSVPLRRIHYDRVHLQYEAINAALPLLELAGTRNDHRWDKRCVEFESDPVPSDGFMLETE